MGLTGGLFQQHQIELRLSELSWVSPLHPSQPGIIFITSNPIMSPSCLKPRTYEMPSRSLACPSRSFTTRPCCHLSTIILTMAPSTLSSSRQRACGALSVPYPLHPQAFTCSLLCSQCSPFPCCPSELPHSV